MIKIGLISAATYGYMGAKRTPGSFHGTAFSSTFNGYDAEKAKKISDKYQWTFAPAGRTIPGAVVTKVWDPNKAWAKRLAEVAYIDEVCDKPEDCAEGVDACVIVDDGSGDQCEYAFAPLAKGIPTFCDKPLAMTAKRAKEVADFAKKHKALLMSASSLRFVPDIVKLRDEMPSLGEVYLAQAICGNELVYYGIHALETAYAVLGRGAVSCMNVGQPGRAVVRVRFENGRDLVLMVGERDWMQAGYQINVYAKGGWRSVMPDLSDLYIYLMEQFIKAVRTGKEVVPIDESVEVIAVLEAGKRSLAEGREVTVAEMLA